MTRKQWKFSMLYWHYYVFFAEKLKLKSVIRKTTKNNKSITECAKIIWSSRYNVRPLSCKNKPENKLHLLEPTRFLLIQAEDQG